MVRVKLSEAGKRACSLREAGEVEKLDGLSAGRAQQISADFVCDLYRYKSRLRTPDADAAI